MPRAKVVLTGATGFLGRHFLYDLLASDPDVEVVAIARGSDTAQARCRIVSALERAAQSRDLPPAPNAVERIEVIAGDILEPLCGLSDGTVDRLRNGTVHEVWHLAATTNFELSYSAIERTNVNGAASALGLAARVGAQRFVHTSTSYCCGQVTGAIREELHPMTAPFTNEYERSKCESEHGVLATAAELEIDARILRPSIVVGPRRTFIADDARHGMYGFLRGVYGAREVLAFVPRPLRLSGDPDAPLNLVPVDEVTAIMTALRDAGFPGGPIHHLTSDRCPSLGEALAAVCDAAGVPRFELIRGTLREPTAFETMLAESTRFYAGYLHGVKSFVRSFGPSVTVSAADVRRLCARWVEERCARRSLAAPTSGAANVRA